MNFRFAHPTFMLLTITDTKMNDRIKDNTGIVEF